MRAILTAWHNVARVRADRERGSNGPLARGLGSTSGWGGVGGGGCPSAEHSYENRKFLIDRAGPIRDRSLAARGLLATGSLGRRECDRRDRVTKRVRHARTRDGHSPRRKSGVKATSQASSRAQCIPSTQWIRRCRESTRLERV